jgi:hypothetical protein
MAWRQLYSDIRSPKLHDEMGYDSAPDDEEDYPGEDSNR